jgi:methionyl-tRNA formyltransferase
MQMDIGLDSGDMLLKSHLSVGLLDTFFDVAAALAEQCADLLVETLRKLAQGTLIPEPQDDALATYAPLIQKADYELNWKQTAIALHNRVRGFYPNTVTIFRGQPLKILATAPLGLPYWPQLPPDLAQLQPSVDALMPEANQALPGTIVGLLKGHGPVVQTGDGLLLLREVKPSGKQNQRGADFVNGSRIQVGESF